MIRSSIQKKLNQKQKGFTLVELAITGFVLGLLSMILSVTVKSMLGANTQAYIQEQTVINQKIATAINNHLMSSQRWEKGVTAGDPLFLLPDPYGNGSNINYGITDTSVVSGTGYYDTASGAPEKYLVYHILQQNVPLSKINGDGTAGDMVRVYQKYNCDLTGCTTNQLSTELNFLNPGPASAGFTGGKVVLGYDLGVIYLTNCQRSKTSTCNRAGALPNAAMSPAASLYAASTWTPLASDIGVTYVSSLPSQLVLLEKFRKQIDQLRTSLKNYASTYSTSPLGGRALACSNAGVADTGNNSPYPRNACSSKNYAWVGAQDDSVQTTSAGTANNQGCWDGWYSLNAENVSILKEIGLPVAEYSTTPWGGPIQYCADYTPADVYGGTQKLPAKIKNVKPIYAAIRFNRYLTERQYPVTDTSMQNDNNIIISF